TGQTPPADDAQIVRCIFESLALRYREVIDMLDQVATFPIERLHVIGGGSKNRLLNQFTANAIGRKVVAGPSEATAIGNVMIQAMAAGAVSSLKEMREMIHQAIETEEYQPQQADVWEEAYQKYQTLNR
ncbi:MAG: rhamnulokinase, partial [Bacteroidaceae bacterium]|nr:rhamnulokinase [Bacteroidaceae bacterium]